MDAHFHSHDGPGVSTGPAWAAFLSRRATWAKRIGFVLLLLLGLFLWIPQLLRATVAETATDSESPPTSPQADPVISDFSDDSNANRPTIIRISAQAALQARYTPANDLSACRVDIGRLLSATFQQADGIGLARVGEIECGVPELLRAPSSVPLVAPHRNQTANPAARNGVVLTGTIIGKARRGAILNGRLYREGDTISAQGHRFRVATVSSERVVLARDGRRDAQCKIVLRVAYGGNAHSHESD